MNAAKLLADAMELPADEREDLAAKLLDSLEPPHAISIQDEAEIMARAEDARARVAGVPWDQLKRDLLK